MKSIQTIIKVNKQALDEKRQELAELEGQKEQLINWQKKMKDELAKEFDFAVKNPEMSITFDYYRKLISRRQVNLQLALNDLNLQIENITLQIAELFGEVKKYEIIEQQKLAKILKEQKLRDSKALDEIAISNYLKERNGQ
ncbi:MAG: flagellar FliJ family protein [Rickettsiales bacterium]|nr:flagellar FliJ family protein [Pseudomonadota bacterium]MDA0965938.1 flagellar FliJ family protein [Pseudomonadota bacterium]MDG4542592.1 flagellar FliJ family protein [Rickettsiales bacterium]MDG4545096.1 flagellar FliJ family protein [Rickettsiales bacterium]MDG4547219.1 flagellar FliJ family protein [Rickettsiales bacterium]